jgi:hypothetical protein
MSGKKAKLRKVALAELLAVRDLDAEAFEALLALARILARSEVDTNR